MAVIFIFFFFFMLNCCFVLTHKLSACFAVKSQPFLRYDLKFFDVFVRLFEYMNASYFNTQLHDKTISSVLFSDCNESKDFVPIFQKSNLYQVTRFFILFFIDAQNKSSTTTRTHKKAKIEGNDIGIRTTETVRWVSLEQ